MALQPEQNDECCRNEAWERQARSKLEKKAVVSKTSEETKASILRYCTATIHCQCQQVRIVLKCFHGNLKLSKKNLMMQFINTFVR